MYGHIRHPVVLKMCTKKSKSLNAFTAGSSVA